MPSPACGKHRRESGAATQGAGTYDAAVFEKFSLAPPDPILGLATRIAADRRPGVLDLTSGVYKDASGLVAKFAAVTEAEQPLPGR